VLGTLAVDRTLVLDAERTWLAGPDMVSTHFDLQPAIAACRAVSTGSQVLLVQMTRPQLYRRCSLNSISIANATELNPERMAVAL
jgi:hypothetical protein